MREVIRLNQHVREFGERDPGFHARFHRVLLQHVVDCEVLAGIPEKLKQRELQLL